MALQDHLATIPASMARLPRDPRGYPIPWFVDMKAPPHNGGPDFRIMDGKHLKIAMRERRCWVCGGRLLGEHGTFVAGPMCGVNRTSAEPPCHLDCARWSAMACPFLSQPKRIRDESGLPTEKHVAGVGITRNPGVTMLWTCESFETWRPPNGGVLFNFGEPVLVEWYAQGRLATREEVETSVETGLPLLLKEAVKDGALGCFELGRSTERFIKYLPKPSPALQVEAA